MTVTEPRAAVETADVRPGWWHEPFDMFQTNLREIDALLDVETVLDAIQEHGAGVWLLNVGGILSHFPSTLPFQSRNPLLEERPGGDLVGDAIEAAHRRGVRLLARMDFSKVAARVADEHPEWCFRSPSGERQVYEGLVSVCPSAGYYQDRSLDIIDEILDAYPVDGFFFNWFGFNEVDYGGRVHGVCHCDACAEAFVRETGIEQLPSFAGDPGYLEWKRFAAATIDRLTARIRGHIAERAPHAGLILGRSADILFHEANNALGRPLWPHATSESVSAFRVAQPGKPVLVNAVAFIDMPYRLASEQPEMFGQYLLQAVSRGANPSTYIMGPAGLIDYACLAPAGVVTRFHRDHADLYAGLAPAADVGIVRPNPLAAPAEVHHSSIAEFRGLFSALLERHVAVDVVPAESLPVVDLGRFRVLVLPDLIAPTAEEDAALAAFVRAGGRVVATGRSGIHADGSVVAWLPGARQRSLEDDAEALKSSYVQRGGGPSVEGSDLVPVRGRLHTLAWRSDARLRHEFVPRAPYGPPEKAHGHVVGPVSACGVFTLGRGRATQVPWTVGAAYRELGLTAIRDLIADLVIDAVGEDGTVGVEASEHVEVSVGRSRAGLVVHVLNHSGQRRNSFGPTVPVRGTRLRFPGRAADAVGTRVHHVTAGDVDATVSTVGDDLLVEIVEVVDGAVVVVPDGGERDDA
ncbi:beta-galactosidase trimerization domain-containing protein [Plantibacter flavus]|uniref:beta-galactosidase trimerization domain-containing protein n=1 Tax=Plantibacter flavus TaxID=150123 RepID=UPI000EB2C421